jgi:hypothetical protein
MEAAKKPVDALTRNPPPLRAAGAVAGWCAEGWLLADRTLQEAAAQALTSAFCNNCEPWSYIPLAVEKIDPLAELSGGSEGLMVHCMSQSLDTCILPLL